MGTFRFGNGHFAAITGYDYYVHGNVTLCHVYYVEGLRHNLFSVGETLIPHISFLVVYLFCVYLFIISIDYSILHHEERESTTDKYPLVLPTALRARFNQELHKISAFVDSHLESIERFINRFADQPNETNINDPESDDGSIDTPLVSPFPHYDNDSDDEEVLNKLSEYENAGTLRRERIINSFDGDDLAFECMIGFRKFTAYLDPFLPMNIISGKAYNTIMVDKLEGTGKNLVVIVRDVYVFVVSFTYITDFVVLEDIGEFIMSDIAEVLMGKPFRKITKLKYDVAKGLVSFTKIFDTCTYRMPRTIPRLKNFNWSKVPPLLELSQNDLMNRFRHPYEKNKFMYKNCLNLGLEYQVNESIKEWLIRGHVSIHETM
ncbi:hypothetical protein Tco_0981253 [Tanacetum coccineum]